MLKPDKCPICRSIVCYLIFTLLLVFSIPPDAGAMLVPSSLSSVASDNGETGSPDSDKETDILKIRTFLESRIVAQRLNDLGFSSEEVSARLSQLSPKQIHNIATKIDSLRPGGDALGVVISLLVIAILVIIILQMTGHKVIITQ